MALTQWLPIPKHTVIRNSDDKSHRIRDISSYLTNSVDYKIYAEYTHNDTDITDVRVENGDLFFDTDNISGIVKKTILLNANKEDDEQILSTVMALEIVTV